MISRFRSILALTLMALLAGTGGLLAQNTAPVPTTFDIISPADGNASSLINTNFSTNKHIFYGGDFFYNGSSNAGGFRGYTFGGDKDATQIARGNSSGSRLTLGGTEYGTDATYPAEGVSYVTNLPGSRAVATSYDPDDTGGPATYLDYHGMNGFIAISEGDTLEIVLTGFIDPNNKMVKGDQAADLDYTGRNLKSQDGDGTSGHDGANNVTYSAVNLPAGATFVSNRLRWVPNFLQGDGATDNSIHAGRVFVDANISNGTTTSETTISSGDTTSSASKVGLGVGELRDSLYVIYFKATDDSNQGNDNAMDSLFILVNDSLPNPKPHFTSRSMLRKDSLGVQQTRIFNYLAGAPDTLFSVFEGDSVVVTFNGSDQDSIQGETNDAVAFGLLWNDTLLGVSKGGTTSGNLSGYNQFIHRAGSLDTLAVDTVSTLSGGSAMSFRFRLQIPYNLATSSEKADSLVVMISDGNTIVADTFGLKVRNTNRASIWDNDTSSTPSDSALAFSLTPQTVYPDSIQAVLPLTLNNGVTDSTYFSQYVFDPDFLIGDSIGYPLTYSYSGNHQGTLTSSTGLNVFQPSEQDTVTYTFNIIATDGNVTNAKSTSQQIKFRVAPAPSISKVLPSKGSVGDVFTISGTGFGLYDRNAADTSRVIFYAPDANGKRQYIQATITSWSKEKIVASVPWGVLASGYDSGHNYLVPDTIKVVSAIYGGFDTYPFVVLNDSLFFDNLEVVNVTSTSASIRYRTSSTGADSVVVASSSDTLDIHSAAFTNMSKFKTFPTFVQYNSGLSEIRSTVQVFHDQTSTSDYTHIITLTDLSPNTLYRFFIGTGSGTFSADSLHNVNGPYRPKKIDRATAANNAALSAFRLRTVPVTGATGNIYMVKGKVYYSGGAATNSTVKLRMVSPGSAADSSLPIIATVGSDSTWQLNLANLKTSDGSGFNHTQGDYMVFEFDGAEKGYEQYDTVRASDAANPMTIRTIKLVPRIAYEVDLKTGLNLMAIPHRLYKLEPSTAHSLLNAIQGGIPAISRYISSTGVQQTITKTVSGSFIGASDFNLNVEEAYFVKVNSDNTITFNGRIFTDNVATLSFAAAGYFYVSRPAQDASKFKSWDALGIVTSVANVSEVIRFNTTLQQYDQYTAGGGTNFGIDVGQGYIFHLTGASSWNPNASGTLLAGVSDKPAGSPTPGMTLDAVGSANSAKAGGLTISNITSSAAVFTWNPGSGPAGSLKLVQADGKVILAQPTTLKSGLCYVLVTGLKPALEYKYAVEGLSGASGDNTIAGTFSSAAVGAGITPYAMYGHLLDSQGNPLEGMLVMMRLRSAQSGVESAYISTVSDDKGNWILNLANFKEQASGLPFAWAEGDQVELSVLGDNFSQTYTSTVQPGSPHNFALDLKDEGGNTDTDATVEEPVSLPKAYSLAQNVPNPFNPSTTIHYSLPEGGGQVQVRLDVFNLRGQIVRTLVSAVRAPGEYQVEWDGADSGGRVVASGVYFYRLTTPQFKATRKMIILK